MEEVFIVDAYVDAYDLYNTDIMNKAFRQYLCTCLYADNHLKGAERQEVMDEVNYIEQFLLPKAFTALRSTFDFPWTEKENNGQPILQYAGQFFTGYSALTGNVGEFFYKRYGFPEKTDAEGLRREMKDYALPFLQKFEKLLADFESMEKEPFYIKYRDITAVGNRESDEYLANLDLSTTPYIYSEHYKDRIADDAQGCAIYLSNISGLAPALKESGFDVMERDGKVFLKNDVRWLCKWSFVDHKTVPGMWYEVDPENTYIEFHVTPEGETTFSTFYMKLYNEPEHKASFRDKVPIKMDDRVKALLLKKCRKQEILKEDALNYDCV